MKHKKKLRTRYLALLLLLSIPTNLQASNAIDLIALQLPPIWQALSPHHELLSVYDIKLRLQPTSYLSNNLITIEKILDELDRRDTSESKRLLELLHHHFYELFVHFIAQLHITIKDKTKLLTTLDEIYHFPIRTDIPTGSQPFRLTLTHAILSILIINLNRAFYSTKQERLYTITSDLKRELLAINSSLRKDKVIAGNIALTETLDDKVISEFVHLLNLFGIKRLPAGTLVNRTMFGLKMGVAAVTIVAFASMAYTIATLRKKLAASDSKDLGGAIGTGLGTPLGKSIEVVGPEIGTAAKEAIIVLGDTAKEAVVEGLPATAEKFVLVNDQLSKQADKLRELKRFNLRRAAFVLTHQDYYDDDELLEVIDEVCDEKLRKKLWDAHNSDNQHAFEKYVTQATHETTQALADIEEWYRNTQSSPLRQLAHGVNDTIGTSEALKVAMKVVMGRPDTPVEDPDAQMAYLPWMVKKTGEQVGHVCWTPWYLTKGLYHAGIGWYPTMPWQQEIQNVNDDEDLDDEDGT